MDLSFQITIAKYKHPIYFYFCYLKSFNCGPVLLKYVTDNRTVIL